MEKNFTQIPFIAFDYITKGDKTGLSLEQIEMVDEWLKEWEFKNIDEYVVNDRLSSNITNSIFDDMDFEEITDTDYG